MFGSNVCLVFLIWCQVLSLSAAENEETTGDHVMGLRSRTLLKVPGHSPGADWDTEIKGATANGQVTASGDRFHQEQLFEELKNYKFVFPQILSGKQKRSVAVLPQRSYPNHISISVKLEGEDLTLDLRRNKFLLPRGFQVSYYDSNGTLVTEKDTELYHCYYEGSVRRFPRSQVSASTCSGLSALIVFSNQTYIIEHLEGDKLGRHLLYRPEDLKSFPSRCGVINTSPELTLTEHLQRSQRMKRDVLQERRYLELVLVADNTLYRNLGYNRDAVVQRMLKAANAVDMFYKPYKIRIALIGVEVWSSNPITVDRDARGTLARFLSWRKNDLLPRLHNDNAHLIIGGYFTKGIAGLAMFGGICSAEQSGGVNLDNRPSFLAVAATLAHEMGHNLGMSHDTEDRHCNCPDQKAGCLMEEAQGFTLPTIFSSCSREDLRRNLHFGAGMCLYNLPRLDLLVGGPKCGNLYLEKGEECDCGKPEECSDSCCEPSTCKLKPGAKCSSTGACCKNCRFLPAGTVCRPLRGECDLPEFCTGSSSDCPDNVYLKDGHTCSNGNLYCNDGTCQSVDKQCQEIWGDGARSAEEVCYKLTNKQGNDFGNCGKDENDEYIKCRTEDVECGKIQCKGGNKTPIRGGNLNVITTSIIIKGVKYKCRGTFSTLPDSSSPDLIRQGTKCGDNKACIDAKCQDVTLFNLQHCDETCNNKGVCNNKGNCHCDDGWAPPYCTSTGEGGSIDSGNWNDTDTVTTRKTTVPAPTTERTTTPVTTRKTTVPAPTTERTTTPAASPKTTLTEPEQRTGVTPVTPDSTILIISIVVPILILSIMICLLAWLLVKKRMICRRVRATTPETQTSSAIRAGENKVLFVSEQEMVHSERADVDVSTSLRDPLPNTTV
ncbi:disintegrin and metalloproteinase domain-containing protein 12-like isoform X3 [Heterodontus francisci]|uniref:disintegrin and metalloproteinase domain-containing protein 12-like isoform X3 n=1 Tax=Heterodontus francisci TaxID=7792 RepID=UPI00355B4A56